MNSHRYILEPYQGMKTRYICPGCNKREFVRYIDTETGKHISPAVGRCNRESNCGYHYTPGQYFKDNHISTPQQPVFQPTPTKKPTSFIPVEIFKMSLGSHEQNNFIKFLLDLFPVQVVKALISKYFIGTSNHWSGSCVFWQIDLQGHIRSGKIMLYNATTGKRVKEPTNCISWVHAVLKLNDYNLKQCFFGEHLLQDRTKPVAIVESEKTAVISSVYFPQLIWLAAGSLNNINPEKCRVLKGRKVILFPDVKGFEKWNEKAKELNFICSDLLELNARPEERTQGFDLADYLIKYDYREFTEPPSGERFNDIEPQGFQKAEKTRRENWTGEIQDLEQFFKAVPLPSESVRLNQCSTIIDISKFINSGLSIVKAQNGNRRYLPYLERLQELKRILKLNLN